MERQNIKETTHFKTMVSYKQEPVPEAEWGERLNALVEDGIQSLAPAPTPHIMIMIHVQSAWRGDVYCNLVDNRPGGVTSIAI
jgi:hypothetical protein